MIDIGRIVVPAEVPAGYALFYTTTDFEGHLRGDGAVQVLRVIQQRFGIDATLVTCVQVHGANIVRAPAETSWRECDSCDALWSDQPGLALTIKVADCLPVTLIDDAHGVIANIHSGWRGAVQGITGTTLDVVADFSDRHEVLAGRIFDFPVLVAFAGINRARIAATHGDNDVSSAHDVVCHRFWKFLTDVDANLV